MKQYKNHSEVPQKYKWDLSFLLEGKSLEFRLDECLNLFQELVKNNDTKYDSSNKYLEYLKLEDKLSAKFFKLHNYLSNSISLNVVDPIAKEANQKLEFEMHKMSQLLGAENFKFFQNASKLKQWIELSEFKDYKRSIEFKLEEEKHQLPKEIEEFRKKQSRADISAYEVFSILSNAETKFGFAETKNGKKIAITQTNISQLVKHPDSKVRKTASINYRNAFLAHKGSFTSLTYQHRKQEATWSKIYGFDSTVESFIFDDRVPKDFLNTLYGSVQKNKDIFVAYNNAFKKFYFAKFGEKPTKYDFARELTSVKSKYSPDEGIQIILEAFKPFGSEYISVVEKGIKENWVDFYPVDNKRSGAYSIGSCYGIDKKLILMNWDDSFHSVTTLAHEFGHSMHSYYSAKALNIRDSEYKIFVAEIASIFNELIVFDYLLNSQSDDKFKFTIRKQMIDGFIGTVMRQTEWSNFEFDFYEALDKGTPLGTYESLSKMYFENSKKYSIKKKMIYKPEEQFKAIYVPHFYYGFYVYKYAIGQLVANIFFQKYKENGTNVLEEYIQKFLSAGCLKDPIDLLKDAGVDLLNPKIYEIGFKAVEENIKEFIKLGNKIFKIKK